MTNHNFEPITPEKKQQLEEMMAHPLWTAFPQSVEDSYRFGWARSTCFLADTLYFGNWYKWLTILGKGEWKKGDPYPYLTISESGNEAVKKMLKKSFEPVSYKGVRPYEFLSWIGYAIGLAWFEKPNMDKDSWEHLYRTFDFSLFYQFPSDYLSVFLAENGSSGALDYYPTPLSLSKAMNLMLQGDEEEKVLTDLMYDPCTGTGALILPSKSLNIVASDLSHLMVRAAAIQAFFYKPSVIYVPRPIIGIHADPKELRINKYFEFDVNSRIYQGDALTGEFIAPVNIFLEGSEFVDVYFHPLNLKKHKIYDYEQELAKPWNTIEREKQIEIVAAMAREIMPDQTISNPPFNMKMPKREQENIQSIIRSNKEFIDSRKGNSMMNLFNQIQTEAAAKTEFILANSTGKNKEQLMFVF